MIQSHRAFLLFYSLSSLLVKLQTRNGSLEDVNGIIIEKHNNHEYLRNNNEHVEGSTKNSPFYFILYNHVVLTPFFLHFNRSVF